jgi:hypothetical protein
MKTLKVEAVYRWHTKPSPTSHGIFGKVYNARRLHTQTSTRTTVNKAGSSGYIIESRAMNKSDRIVVTGAAGSVPVRAERGNPACTPGRVRFGLREPATVRGLQPPAHGQIRSLTIVRPKGPTPHEGNDVGRFDGHRASVLRSPLYPGASARSFSFRTYGWIGHDQTGRVERAFYAAGN